MSNHEFGLSWSSYRHICLCFVLMLNRCFKTSQIQANQESVLFFWQYLWILVGKKRYAAHTFRKPSCNLLKIVLNQGRISQPNKEQHILVWKCLQKATKLEKKKLISQRGMFIECWMLNITGSCLLLNLQKCQCVCLLLIYHEKKVHKLSRLVWCNLSSPANNLIRTLRYKLNIKSHLPRRFKKYILAAVINPPNKPRHFRHIKTSNLYAHSDGSICGTSVSVWVCVIFPFSISPHAAAVLMWNMNMTDGSACRLDICSKQIGLQWLINGLCSTVIRHTEPPLGSGHFSIITAANKTHMQACL